MKIHFASALPQQCFCQGWQDFILRSSAFTSASLAKTSTRCKLVRLLPLLHISPRMRSITSASLAKTSTRCKLVRLLPLLHISPRMRSIMYIIQFKLLKDHLYTFKVRCHPLFVAVYVIIISIHFIYMTNNRFTSQSSLLSIWL